MVGKARDSDETTGVSDCIARDVTSDLDNNGIFSVPKEQPEELLSGEVSIMVSDSEIELPSSHTSEEVAVLLSTGTGSTTDKVRNGSVKTTLIVLLSFTSLMSRTVKKTQLKSSSWYSSLKSSSMAKVSLKI